MKTVINKTQAPLRVALPAGKFLRLGPGKSGQIRDEDSDGDAITKLVESGALEIHQGEIHTGSGATTGGVHKTGGPQRRATSHQRKGER
jgi:hypothetical protein